MKKSKNTLIIKSSTWNKESTELLDYESEDVLRTNLLTKLESLFVRKGNTIKLIKSKTEMENSDTFLFKISIKNNFFYLNPNIKKNEEKDNININNLNWSDASWFIIKKFKNKKSEDGYLINPGDMIKLGRIKLKINEIVLPGYEEKNAKEKNEKNNMEEDRDNKENKDNKELKENNNKTEKDKIKEENKNKNVNDEIKSEYSKKNKEKDKEKELQKNYNSDKKSLCRICYCNERELDSPLIRPCNCSGSMKYIHFCCLQKWLQSKIQVKSSANQNSINYSFKLIECELCKTLLPDFVKYKDNLYEIFDFTKQKFKYYISFETISNDRNNKNLYILNMENKDSIKIGRSQDSDIRITDISVSRFHSLIKKNSEGKLILTDNNSKFGTLILIQNPELRIINNFPLSFQIGRSIFNLSVKYPCTLFSCFSKKSNLLVDDDYQNLNFPFVRKENNNVIKIQDIDDESDIFSSVNNNLETERKEEEDEIQKKIKERQQQLNLDRESFNDQNLNTERYRGDYRENINTNNNNIENLAINEEEDQINSNNLNGQNPNNLNNQNVENLNNNSYRIDRENSEEEAEEVNDDELIMEINNEILENDLENKGKFEQQHNHNPNLILIEKQNSNMESKLEEFEKNVTRKMPSNKTRENFSQKEKINSNFYNKNDIGMEVELENFRKNRNGLKRNFKSNKNLNSSQYDLDGMKIEYYDFNQKKNKGIKANDANDGIDSLDNDNENENKYDNNENKDSDYNELSNIENKERENIQNLKDIKLKIEENIELKSSENNNKKDNKTLNNINNNDFENKAAKNSISNFTTLNNPNNDKSKNIKEVDIESIEKKLILLKKEKEKMAKSELDPQERDRLKNFKDFENDEEDNNYFNTEKLNRSISENLDIRINKFPSINNNDIRTLK